MANYFVINNKFKPYSFDELIKPYQIYGQAYKEQEAMLDDAMANEFSPDNLDAIQDKAAYDMYNAADQGLKAVSDELATRGLSPQLRNRLRNTAKEYKRTMTSLNNAQEQLNAERDRRAKLGPDYVYQQGDLRIGDFLGGKRPNDESASLSGITKDIAAEFGARAKGITSDTWDKVFASNGKVIGGYFDVRTDEGLTAAQLDTILDGVVTGDGSTWASVMNNPTITNEQKKQLQGFRNSIISKKESLGFGNYDLGAQRKINEAIVLGAHGGLGSTTHKYQRDEAYNPLGWSNYDLNLRKYNDAIAEAESPYTHEDEKNPSPANRTGLKPGYTIKNGKLQYGSDSSGSSSSSSGGSGGGGTKNQRKPARGVTIYDEDGTVSKDYSGINKDSQEAMTGMSEVTNTKDAFFVKGSENPIYVDSLTDTSYKNIASKVDIPIGPGEILDDDRKQQILDAAKALGVDIRTKTTRDKNGKIKKQELAIIDRGSTIIGSTNMSDDTLLGTFDPNGEPVYEDDELNEG